MTTVNLTGTAAPEDTATAALTDQGVQRVVLNNGYTASVLSATNAHPGYVVLSKSGSAVVGPVSQGEVKQLWIDLAELGLNA